MRSSNNPFWRRVRLIAAGWLVATAFAATPALNYDESKVGNTPLPDPLRCDDGTMVRDVATWRTKSRPELLRLFASEVYGRTPTAPVVHTESKVTAVDRTALGGKATRKEVTLTFRTEGRPPVALHVLIYLPNARQGPAAVFVGLNYFGNQCVDPDPGITLSTAWLRPSPEYHVVNNHATEGTRGAQASRWNVPMVVARGYATATACYGDLCPDRDDGMEEAVGALFHSGSVNQRPADGWGSIGIWAWGLSRIADYIATDADLDAGRMAVHGHSRLGKTALWAGAQDERFALVISNCSGAGGAALAKRIFGETVALSNSRHSTPWFALNYRKYNDHEERLPVDQHELIALMAPRPVYVASASKDLLADPRGEFLSAFHAGPVYRLFGKEGVSRTPDFPPVDSPIGATIRYHVRTGDHDITAYDWAQYLDFADGEFRGVR